MGSSKAAAAYRDEEDHDDAASMSSAVLLGDIDSLLNDDLPPYSDIQPYTDETSSSASHLDPSARVESVRADHGAAYNPTPPEVPFSSHDSGYMEISTRFPDYSTDASTLASMLHKQSSYPPPYFVQLVGTHTETTRQNNKETKKTIKDFTLQINITSLLGDCEVECLPDNKRGYRGGRIPTFHPNVSDVENQLDPIRRWCDRFVKDAASVRTFTMKREITNHDTKKLEQLLRTAIAETNYRGRLSVKFPTTYNRLTVYTPGRINQWRTTKWICWMFYLTFLWVLSWPVLLFITRKYEVIKVSYPYANIPVGQPGERECAVMTEVEWFDLWQSAIKRAALARIQCDDSCLDDDYRIATRNADARGAAQPSIEVPRTGNALADGALGLLSQGLRVAETWNYSGGWGADC